MTEPGLQIRLCFLFSLKTKNNILNFREIQNISHPNEMRVYHNFEKRNYITFAEGKYITDGQFVNYLYKKNKEEIINNKE